MKPINIPVPLPEVALSAGPAISFGANVPVVFSHGSGSSWLSPGNRFIAERAFNTITNRLPAENRMK